jgi:predicted ATPase
VAGAGQVVLLSGEAGLGKSRLLLELKMRLADEPPVVLECRCSPHFESTALFPIVDALQRRWQLPRGDAADQAFARLLAAVAESVPEIPDAAALLGNLFSIPLPAEIPSLDLSPQRRKERTLEVLVAVLSGMAARAPLLFAIEDLHWIDPSTLELLELVVRRAPAARLLVLLLFRPTFAAPWSAGEHVTRIDLARLGPEVVGDQPLHAIDEDGLETGVRKMFVAMAALRRRDLKRGLVRHRIHHLECTAFSLHGAEPLLSAIRVKFCIAEHIRPA